MRTVEEVDRELAAMRAEVPEATPTEVYARIVGYYRSLSGWNKGKQQEYRRRRVYAEPPADYVPLREVEWR